MKRLLIPTLALLIGTQTFAQVPDISSFEETINTFSEVLAPALPMNASIGGTWSDAWIGHLLGVPPHFGIGFTTGATFIPSQGLDDLITTLDPSASLPSELKSLGLPLPGAVVDARIGGFLLPFDVGVKVGFLPEPVKAMIAGSANGLEMDYRIIGADVRYALMQENLLLPGISIGVGFTRLDGSVGIKPFGGDVVFEGIPYYIDNDSSGTITAGDTVADDGRLVLSDPQMKLQWSSNVIDLKAQISKSLFIITPYAGLGASIGLSDAGGGLYTNISITDSTGTQDIASGQEAVDLIEQAKAQLGNGQDLPTINADGINTSTTFNGWAFRIYGGTSVNLFVFRLDVQGQFNLIDQTLGVNVGARFQL